MSDCDIKAILSPTSPGISGTIDNQQTLTLKQDSAECCAIDLLQDVDITQYSGNGTVLVYDNQYDIYVRQYLDANFINDLDVYISNYLNSNDVVIDHLTVTGNTIINRILTSNSVSISDYLIVNGDIVFTGDTFTFGDNNTVINLNATVNNHFVSTTTNIFDLGSTTNYWRTLYVQNINNANSISVNNITVVANVDARTINTTNIDARTVNTTNVFTSNIVVDNSITIGDIIIGGDTVNFGTLGGNTVFNLFATVNNHITPTTTNIYDLGSTTNRWNTFYGIDIDITGDLRVDGEIVLRGDVLTLGDGGDVINIGATVNSHLLPTTDSLFDIGSTSIRWRNVYADYYYGDGSNLTISKGWERTPSYLANGQLHYSFSSDKLYIGQTNTEISTPTVEYIGGKLLVDKVANLESILAGGGSVKVSNAIVTGTVTANEIVANGAFRFTPGNFEDNGVLWTNISGTVNFATGSGGEVLQISSNTGQPVFESINGGTY